MARLQTVVIEAVPDVEDVHHVHAWSLTPEKPLITLHARVGSDADHDKVMQGINEVLMRKFGVAHATIQIERGRCLDEPADA